MITFPIWEKLSREKLSRFIELLFLLQKASLYKVIFISLSTNGSLVMFYSGLPCKPPPLEVDHPAGCEARLGRPSRSASQA
jgi:hypothetical protein